MNRENRVDYNTKVLEVENLRKYFYYGTGKRKLTVPAVDGLTFDVYKREVFGLVGESGCGKTTTGRTIIKLYNPTEGIVKLNQEVICAGTKQHVREIKRINKEAKEKILSFDKRSFDINQITHKRDDEIKFLKSEIEIIKRNDLERITEIIQPIEDLKTQVYKTKNAFETDIESINYDFFIESKKITDLITNSAEIDYKRDILGAQENHKRKVQGLKESSALNQDVIDSRIVQLDKDLEDSLSRLEVKYIPLIAAQEKLIIPKDSAKEQVKVLKEKRNLLITNRKNQYKIEKTQFNVVNKTLINSEVAKVKEQSKKKIAVFEKQISDLKAKASKAISLVPNNTELGVDQEQMKKDINSIKEWQSQAVKDEKEKIHNLKSINKSKEALVASRKMQMIFQDPISSLNPRMTVQEIVGEGLTIIGGFSKEEIKEKVGETLELVGLSRDYAARYPHEFSGGQRQRIGVARALIMNPDFIIADEPISSLDVSIRAQVINLLQELKESLGLTILFIAHDLSVVRFFCDRIAVMYNGKIVELADSEELFRNPMHPYTKSLLSSIPQPDPDYERDRVRISYNPRQHDYRIDKPQMHEIAHLHYIYANDKELAVIQEAYDKNNNSNATAKGDE